MSSRRGVPRQDEHVGVQTELIDAAVQLQGDVSAGTGSGVRGQREAAGMSINESLCVNFIYDQREKCIFKQHNRRM